MDYKIKSVLTHLTTHGITPRLFNPMICAASPWGSRRKVKMAVSGPVDRANLGIVRRNLSAEDLSGCPLMPDPFQELLAFVRQMIHKHRLIPYDVQAQTGELKYVIIMSNADTSQGIVRFVLRSHSMVPQLRQVAVEMRQSFSWVNVMSCNIQPKHAAILEGPEEIFLTQGRSIRELCGEIPLYFSPQSFMQVTPEVAFQLYGRARDFTHACAPQHVLDLFCGVGGFSLHIAQNTSSLIGVELSESAIESATKSAEELGLAHTSFIAADVDSFLDAYQGPHPDLIIVNPPRRGLSPRTLAHILSLAPRHILYSSCSPESFARDAGLLVGYSLEQLTPFDMFPLTAHCEVLGEFVAN